MKRTSKQEIQKKEEKDRCPFKPAISDMSRLILKKKASKEASLNISKVSEDSMADDHKGWTSNSKIIDFDQSPIMPPTDASLRQKLAENLKKIQVMEKEYQRTSKLRKIAGSGTKTEKEVVSSRLYQPGKAKRQEVKFGGKGSTAIVVDKYLKRGSKKEVSAEKKHNLSSSGYSSINAYFSKPHLTNS